MWCGEASVREVLRTPAAPLHQDGDRRYLVGQGEREGALGGRGGGHGFTKVVVGEEEEEYEDPKEEEAGTGGVNDCQ